ncbi:hypothetical protein ES703_20887 [subsurface metagenome]
MLNAKNTTIGPNDASTASITPNAAIRSRRAETTDNRVPMSALNTYREGNVTARVRKNSIGTLMALAISCMYASPPVRIIANEPMHKPYSTPSNTMATDSPPTGILILPSASNDIRVASPRRILSNCLNHFRILIASLTLVRNYPYNDLTNYDRAYLHICVNRPTLIHKL